MISKNIMNHVTRETENSQSSEVPDLIDVASIPKGYSSLQNLFLFTKLILFLPSKIVTKNHNFLVKLMGKRFQRKVFLGA